MSTLIMHSCPELVKASEQARAIGAYFAAIFAPLRTQEFRNGLAALHRRYEDHKRQRIDAIAVWHGKCYPQGLYQLPCFAFVPMKNHIRVEIFQ